MSKEKHDFLIEVMRFVLLTQNFVCAFSVKLHLNELCSTTELTMINNFLSPTYSSITPSIMILDTLVQKA